MEKLVSEEINNFNLSEKFNKLKNLPQYKSLTEDELRQMLIEKSLFENDDKSISDLDDEEIEEVKEKLELLPEIQKQISSYFKDVDEHKTKIKSDAINPVEEFYKELTELKIDLSEVNNEAILNIEPLNSLYNRVCLKYYEVKYPKFIRAIIDFFGFTDAIIERLPILNEWKAKFENYDLKLIPIELSKINLYKSFIIEKRPENNETNYRSIIFIINNLIENVKSLLLVYSVVQSNIDNLKEFGIDGFGDHYYHSLISCVGHCVQLKKAFMSLTNLAETQTKAEHTIDFDHILPFYHWIRETWYPSLQESLMNNLSEKHPNIDIVHFIGVIGKDILTKLPPEATTLRELLSGVNEVTNNLIKQKNMLLDNIKYTETSLFTAHLKRYMSKQSIRLVFETDSKQIRIKTMEKVNNK
jgi:hypothetical protein